MNYLALTGLLAQVLTLFDPGFIGRTRGVAAAGCDTLKDSQTATAEEAASVGNVAGNTYVATKFTAGSSYSLCRVDLLLAKAGATGTPTGNVFAYLYSDASGAPGTLLATSDPVDATALPTAGTSNWVSFSFSSPASVASGTVYRVATSYTNTAALSFVYWWRNSAFVSGGVHSSTNGTTWNPLSSRQNNFKTFSN